MTHTSIPDISSYLRDVTDIGPVKAILKRLISLSPARIFSVLIPQLSRLHLLAKKDFTSGILLLAHIELLQEMSKAQAPPADPVFLSQPVTDLCLALNNPRPVRDFIHLLRNYHLRPGLATANLDRLTLFLGRHSLFPDFVLDVSNDLILTTSPGSPCLTPGPPRPLSKPATRILTPPTLSVIIPVYNEAKTVSLLLHHLLRAKILARMQIIIVSDGSTDNTLQELFRYFKRQLQVASANTPLAKDFAQTANHLSPISSRLARWLSGIEITPEGKTAKSNKGGRLSVFKQSVVECLPSIRIIPNLQNQGKGSAIRTGLRYATGDYSVIQDADLEYDPNDLQRLLTFLQHSPSPVVYGSRRLYNPRFRYSHRFFYIGGLILNSITNLLYSQNLTDEATCYKMFKTGFLKSLPLSCRRFEFCPEVTALTSISGHQIPEIPISYSPRSLSQGKKIRPLDGWQAILTLLKYKISHPGPQNTPKET